MTLFVAVNTAFVIVRCWCGKAARASNHASDPVSYMDGSLLKPMLAVTVLMLSVASATAQPLPPGFVHLRNVVPTIRQDIRYHGRFNFTGKRVPGYEAAECILLRETAQALARAQARLNAEGFHLKVYDCYRPARAVLSFIAWAQDGEPDTMAPIFSPKIPKDRQFQLGYLAKRSRHSLGTTVDVGLVRADEPDLPTPVTAGPCDGPFALRGRESSLDMGTAFDCSSELSATHARGVSAEARANRQRLLRAMTAEAFRNFAKEWWHFEFIGPTPELRSWDFPVR